MRTGIIVAVDGLSLRECVGLVSKIGRRVYAIKIHELFDRHGYGAVHQIHHAAGCVVWVDHKLHDIPSAVRLRAAAIGESGAKIVSVHAPGGIEMMRAAVEGSPCMIFAVTVLTSINEQMYSPDRHLLGESVLYLAELARLAGVAGVVCSTAEVGILSKKIQFERMKFIVPGLRSEGQEADDQQRVDTPFNAVRAGATHIVVGRQITRAKDPVAALEALEAEVMQAEMEFA